MGSQVHRNLPLTSTCLQVHWAAGANCSVSVIFSPTKAGDIADSNLDVVTNGATLAIPLYGTAPIVISLAASPAQAAPGLAFTITWDATPGSACYGSGGSPGDGWTAATPSGSVTVQEAIAGTYVYQLGCTAGSQSKSAALSVQVVAPPAPPTHSGGGRFDIWSVIAMMGGLWLRQASRGRDL